MGSPEGREEGRLDEREIEKKRGGRKKRRGIRRGRLRRRERGRKRRRCKRGRGLRRGRLRGREGEGREGGGESEMYMEREERDREW